MGKSIPITLNFDQSIDSVLGKAEFSPEAMKKISALIEAGGIPEFAVGFIGEPDENGVFHKVELVEISMLPKKGPKWKKP